MENRARATFIVLPIAIGCALLLAYWRSSPRSTSDSPIVAQTPAIESPGETLLEPQHDVAPVSEPAPRVAVASHALEVPDPEPAAPDAKEVTEEDYLRARQAYLDLKNAALRTAQKAGGSIPYTTDDCVLLKTMGTEYVSSMQETQAGVAAHSLWPFSPLEYPELYEAKKLMDELQETSGHAGRERVRRAANLIQLQTGPTYVSGQR